MDINRKFGMSADHPECQKNVPNFSPYSNSFSLFGPNKISQTNLETVKNPSAGLNYSNSHHKFHYFNGKKDKPLLFTNLMKNGQVKNQKELFSSGTFESHSNNKIPKKHTIKKISLKDSMIKLLI